MNLINSLYLLLFSELPGSLFIPEIAEALLHVPNGIYLLCRLVANSPDSFQEGNKIIIIIILIQKLSIILATNS